MRLFQPGEKLLLLLPTSDKKLVARWQGPFDVVRKTGETNYEIKMPGRGPEIRGFHVNLLKGWKTRLETVAEGEREEFGPTTQEAPAPAGHVAMGPDLSLPQHQQLEQIQGKYRAVFSMKPGSTKLEEHRIQVKEGVVAMLGPRR